MSFRPATTRRGVAAMLSLSLASCALAGCSIDDLMPGCASESWANHAKAELESVTAPMALGAVVKIGDCDGGGVPALNLNLVLGSVTATRSAIVAAAAPQGWTAHGPCLTKVIDGSTSYIEATSDGGQWAFRGVIIAIPDPSPRCRGGS